MPDPVNNCNQRKPAAGSPKPYSEGPLGVRRAHQEQLLRVRRAKAAFKAGVPRDVVPGGRHQAKEELSQVASHVQLLLLHGSAAAETLSCRQMLQGSLRPAKNTSSVSGTEGSHCGVIGARKPESRAAHQVLKIAALHRGAWCMERRLRRPLEVERALTRLGIKETGTFLMLVPTHIIVSQGLL